MDKKSNAGAVASNAGDDFHLIWACKKLLEVLKPNSEITAISVEGPTWEDSILIEDEQKLYSIDMAEYYGGNNFEQAQYIVFSQLKYSTFQMSKPWTASNLCASTNDKKDNSIIRRLADTYKGFCEKKLDVNQKLTLKLVSNRSLHSSFSDNLDECIAMLKKKKYARTEDLMKNLSCGCKKDINKIYQTSNLGSSAFIDFLLLLDFDDCGTEIRSIHKAEIIKQLSNWGTNNVRSKYNNLIMYLREMMLPEKPPGYPMDKDCILAALETSVNELFPAAAKIEDSNTYIERSISGEFFQYIEEKQNQVICLQAAAGTGKTTFVSHLENYFPEESVSILYDCYGGGAFLQHGERRHLINVAVTQICNSLAVECGTDWLIGQPSQEYEYWRLLNDRLKRAVDYVKQQNPSAVVAIIVDAADNSIVAADTFKENCFLGGLLNQPLPEGVCVIVTTRTERRYLIPFGDETTFIDLPAFELTGSSIHLRSVFREAIDTQCQEFHLFTAGNPRLQAYMLSDNSSMDGLLSQMTPTGKTMDSLFKEFIDATKKQYGSIVDIEILFSVLICLPRPIPETVLSEVCSITFDTLNSISVECRRGFYLEDSFVFLRDEDFETYLRTCYKNNEMATKYIADYMFNNRLTNSYCARYLHVFLNKADRFADLVQISLNEKVDDIAIGVAQTNQIMKQRIQYALKRDEMYDSQKQLLACKLVYKLTEYNAKEEVLQEILFDAPDEVIMYCDDLSVYNIFHTESNRFDNLSKAALAFSHMPAYLDESQQYIRSYLAKVKVHYNKPKKKRGYHSAPKSEDIINIAEALLRLGETKRAVNWICRWDPRKASTKFVFQLFQKFLEYDYTELYELLLSQRWTSPNRLAIVCAYISLGMVPPQEYINHLLRLFTRISKIPVQRFSRKQLLLFAEYILNFEEGTKFVTSLIDKFFIEIQFSNVPAIYTDGPKELSIALRYYVLKHICRGLPFNSADFWKEKKDSDQKRVADNRKTVMKMMDFLLPIYLFRAMCIQSNEDFDFQTTCKEICTKIKGYWRFNSVRGQALGTIGLLAFIEAICFKSDLSLKDISGLVENVLKDIIIPPQSRLHILERLVCNKRAFGAGLVVLNLIDTGFKKYPSPAREMAEVYLSCAKMGRRIEKQAGDKYFAKAIECSKGLDYETYRKIHLYRTLADKIKNMGSPMLSSKVIRLSEDFCRRIGDTKNFPYKEALSAAALLSEKSIWGALSRLDDRDRYDGFSLRHTLSIVLDTLLKENRISIEQALALTGLLLPDLSFQYNDLVDIILDKLLQVPPDRQRPMLEVLIHDVLYNIPMDEKQHRSHRLVEYLDAVVTSPELYTLKIRAIDSFLQQVKNTGFDDDSTESQSEIKLKQYMDESCIVSSQTLQERLESLKGSEQVVFVKEGLQNLAPDKYILAITLVLELLANHYSRFETIEILNSIADFVERAKKWPQIEEWRNDIENQKHFLHAFSKELLYLHSQYDGVFLTILRIFPANATIQHETFLAYVSSHINLFDEQFVKALCRMSVALSEEEAHEFLTWAFDIEMSKIHPASGDSNSFIAEVNQDSDLNTCVVNFIWRLLGHKDRGIRCKASHVLLRSGLVGNAAIIEQISVLYSQQLSQDYIDNNNYFFIESARLWYLATCLRMGKDAPRLLIPLYPFFKSIACSEEVIHALQRRIARNICLQVAPYCEQGIERISVCDQCSISDNYTSREYYQRRGEKCTQNWKFHFDTMDTLPYWYDDLAKLFACTETEIASACDYYVAQFGVTNQSAGEWSRQYLLEEEYSKTSNGHGLIPTIETLEKYAEWHSMFYVADKYRMTKCQVQDEASSYEEWLNKYLPGRAGFWGFEFRNHIPLIPFLWEFIKIIESGSESRYVIPEDLIITMLEHNLGISLNMKYHAHFQQSNQYICIESAFVKREDIGKLIIEMEDPNTMLSYFYYEEEEYDKGEEPELVIYPTCDVIAAFPEDALDKKDLLLKDYSNCLLGISDELAKYFSLTKEQQLLRSRVYEVDTIPVQTYHWSEPEEESGYEECATYGHMVIIEKDCLKDILKSQKQVIVFEVEISFYDDSYNFYGTPSKSAKEKRLFSLERDDESDMVQFKLLSTKAE